MSDEGLWVVINHEEQYSIWPADKDIPRNWRSTDVKGDREQCVQYFVDKLWPDMQPIVINPFRG
jgi:MbtH protein